MSNHAFRIGRPGQRFFIIDYETTGIDPALSEPIEVGIIVTDEHFNALGSYDCLIAPVDQAADWFGEETEAFKVHKIPKNLVLSCGSSMRGVADAIWILARQYTTSCKPVLVSDNIQFEWAFTKRLMETRLGEDVWPFHYCGWDTSLLLEATGVGDPIPAHRALADAGRLHAAIIKAMDRSRRLEIGGTS